MMMSCKEASRLMSEALDRKLAVGERLALRFHVAICAGCTRVEKQLAFLRRAVDKIPAADRVPGEGAQ